MTFLGLDVGGTHCRYEWYPADVLPGGVARGVQPAVHGIEATVTGLAEVLGMATRTTLPTAAVTALAGVGDLRTSMAITTGLRGRGVAFPVAVVGDVVAAAAAALAAGPGVLLWAGTGSFAVARAHNGELIRVGGRGYLLGDQGSGYDFVRRAAAAVLLAIDGLGPPTALTEALTTAFAAPSPQRLGAVLQQLDTGNVSSKLSVVLEVAAGGDAVANEVLESGVDALVMLGTASVRKAGLDWRGLPVAIGGGVVLGAPYLADLITQRLQALGAAAPTAVAVLGPARGAAWLAHGWHHRAEPEYTWVERVAL